MKLFIFGSTGDLIRRKVLPALQDLKTENLEIWALGRRDFTDEIYSDFVCQGRCTLDFKRKIFYKKIELEKNNLCEDCTNLFNKNGINYFYISLPPEFIENALKSIIFLKNLGIKSRILIEKPFGRNLKEAEVLEKLIKNNFSSNEIYLSDHYLFKKEILQIKKTDFRKIKIVSLENVGLEGRIHYDTVGALRDMIQSHFFNIIFKLGGKINPDKLKILKFERFQYGNGIDSGYVKELGKKSNSETLVDLKLSSDGKEFELITGKAFDKKTSFIEMDGKKISFDDEDNSYKEIFRDFLSGKKDNFPTIENAITSWKIIEKIEESKPELKFYKSGISAEDFLKNSV